MIDVQREGRIAVVTFRHENPLNPFSLAMTRGLIPLGAELEADDGLDGVLLWGGAGRSFSAGGDFADIRTLDTPDAFGDYLREIVSSYQALLGISKPVVAAVGGHAIGQGLQVALMADWRLGTAGSRYQMPELANGVPCPLGAAILEALLGRADMLHLVVGCARLDAPEARRFKLIDEIVPDDALFASALERLQAFCAYPSPAWRHTKPIHNGRLQRWLEEVREPAAAAHVASFFSGAADEHFSRILDGDG